MCVVIFTKELTFILKLHHKTGRNKTHRSGQTAWNEIVSIVFSDTSADCIVL